MDYFWLVIGVICLIASYDSFGRRRREQPSKIWIGDPGWLISGCFELITGVVFIAEFCIKHLRFIP